MWIIFEIGLLILIHNPIQIHFRVYFEYLFLKFKNDKVSVHCNPFCADLLRRALVFGKNRSLETLDCPRSEITEQRRNVQILSPRGRIFVLKDLCDI